MAAGSKSILIAEIGAAHGIRGDVRVKAHTGDPQAIGDYGPLHDERGRAYVVSALRPLKDDMLVVRFQGVADRNAAEALNRTRLYVDRSVLPAPAEEEFYHTDLIGLPVVSTTGEALGRVIAVENYGAGDVIEIERPDGKRFMVPMRVEAVPEWNAQRLLLDPVWAE